MSRKLDHVTLHAAQEECLVSLIAKLKEFLNNIVAKDILHQKYCFRLDFAEHSLSVIRPCVIKLVLDEPRPLLVSRKFNNVVVYVLLIG